MHPVTCPAAKGEPMSKQEDIYYVETKANCAEREALEAAKDAVIAALREHLRNRADGGPVTDALANLDSLLSPLPSDETLEQWWDDIRVTGVMSPVTLFAARLLQWVAEQGNKAGDGNGSGHVYLDATAYPTGGYVMSDWLGDWAAELLARHGDGQ